MAFFSIIHIFLSMISLLSILNILHLLKTIRHTKPQKIKIDTLDFDSAKHLLLLEIATYILLLLPSLYPLKMAQYLVERFRGCKAKQLDPMKVQN